MVSARIQDRRTFVLGKAKEICPKFCFQTPFNHRLNPRSWDPVGAGDFPKDIQLPIKGNSCESPDITGVTSPSCWQGQMKFLFPGLETYS